MPFLALTVAAAALSARSLNASVANLSEMSNARTTMARPRSEWERTINVVGLKRELCQDCRDNLWRVSTSPKRSEWL